MKLSWLRVSEVDLRRDPRDARTFQLLPPAGERGGVRAQDLGRLPPRDARRPLQQTDQFLILGGELALDVAVAQHGSSVSWARGTGGAGVAARAVPLSRPEVAACDPWDGRTPGPDRGSQRPMMSARTVRCQVETETF